VILKRLERAARRAGTAAIAALLPAGERGIRPDWRARTHRVLFLRHDRIGDMILSTGILRAIAESHESIALDVLASPANASVVRHEPYLHEIVTFDRHAPLGFPGALRDLRRRRYDAVIDCMVTAPSFTTLLLMLATGAPVRIGVAGRGNDFAYTLPVPPRETAVHLVDQLGALTTAFGLQPSALDLRPRLRLTREEIERAERVWAGDAARGGEHGAAGRVRLLVNVSAGKTARVWPEDRFVAVVRAARERVPRLDAVVISSPADRGRAARIAAESGARLVEDHGIRDAMSIVARAHAAFTPDTSIGHACSAFGIPAVVLFTAGMSPAWAPYETDGRVVESLTPSVLDISAHEAATALQRLLERVASRAG
jgi:ADP-heptose:LPS heptosyltransferase